MIHSMIADFTIFTPHETIFFTFKINLKEHQLNSTT